MIYIGWKEDLSTQTGEEKWKMINLWSCNWFCLLTKKEEIFQVCLISYMKNKEPKKIKSEYVKFSMCYDHKSLFIFIGVYFIVEEKNIFFTFCIMSKWNSDFLNELYTLLYNIFPRCPCIIYLMGQLFNWGQVFAIKISFVRSWILSLSLSDDFEGV